MKPYDSDESKKEQVREMFDNIAPTYDRLNHLLSASADKMWRRRVMRIVRRAGAKRILDVATGTGDLAILMARGIRKSHIMGIDLSEQMLAVAADKIRRRGLDERIVLNPGDAEHLEVASGSIDAVTVAFGVRNFENLPAALLEFHRVLREGGRAVILEFSEPSNPVVRKCYDLYSHRILPRVGAWVSHDRQAYEYLPSSIAEFPEPDRFATLLRDAGFKVCRMRSLALGIAHIYIAKK